MSDLFNPKPVYPHNTNDPSTVVAFVSSHLKVSVEQLWEAIEVGMADAAITTDNSAAMSFGTRLWDGTLTSLRNQLAVSGWTVHRPGGLEVVRRSDNRIQITPSIGNKHTGIFTDGSPKWKHNRGVSTRKAINENQLSLADLAPDDATLRPIQTWWLMYSVRLDAGEKIVRAEISLPVGLSRSGVADWSHRLLLGEHLFGDARPAVIPDAAPDSIVPLLRRAAQA